MGRKGLFSSAAAGASLIAASLVLLIGVSAVIGFRGFRSASALPSKQSVVLKTDGLRDRAGRAATRPAPVVIGDSATRTRPAGSRRASRRPVGRSRQARTAARPAREAAPNRQRLSASPRRRVPAPPAAKQSPAAAPEPAEQKAPPAANPVQQVVEDLTGAVDTVTKPPAEAVGDVLLDLRDVLP